MIDFRIQKFYCVFSLEKLLQPMDNLSSTFSITDRQYRQLLFKRKANTTIMCKTIDFRYIKTSRDRPKSAPYPRLKNSKKTSKCQVFFYSSRKSKIFRKFFFRKNYILKKMDRVARRGSLARAPGALTSHNAEKLKGGTL